MRNPVENDAIVELDTADLERVSGGGFWIVPVVAGVLIADRIISNRRGDGRVTRKEPDAFGGGGGGGGRDGGGVTMRF